MILHIYRDSGTPLFDVKRFDSMSEFDKNQLPLKATEAVVNMTRDQATKLWSYLNAKFNTGGE